MATLAACGGDTDADTEREDELRQEALSGITPAPEASPTQISDERAMQVLAQTSPGLADETAGAKALAVEICDGVRVADEQNMTRDEFATVMASLTTDPAALGAFVPTAVRWQCPELVDYID